MNTWDDKPDCSAFRCACEAAGQLSDECENRGWCRDRQGTHGRLTVLHDGPRKGKNATVVCQCACGNKTVVRVDHLRTGRTKSCGCYRAEATRARRTKTAVDFWARVDIRGPNDCWLWKGGLKSKGYGNFGHNKSAHRYAYEQTYGPALKPCICHHCDNPPCCNPAHLFEGTNADNVADRVRKGRSRNAYNSSRSRNIL